MKRIIWASILLAIAAIILPVLFMKKNADGEYLSDEPSPTPSENVSSEPSQTPDVAKQYDKVSNDNHLYNS